MVSVYSGLKQSAIVSFRLSRSSKIGSPHYFLLNNGLIKVSIPVFSSSVSSPTSFSFTSLTGLISINSFKMEVPIISKLVHWFAEQINGMVFI